jgi:hypothetical protein
MNLANDSKLKKKRFWGERTGVYLKPYARERQEIS